MSDPLCSCGRRHTLWQSCRGERVIRNVTRRGSVRFRLLGCVTNLRIGPPPDGRHLWLEGYDHHSTPGELGTFQRFRRVAVFPEDGLKVEHRRGGPWIVRELRRHT